MKEKQDDKQCPEFPYFGAKYPDARCIDGFLWDLDWCEDGMLTKGGEAPCPFCNREAYIEMLRDNEVEEERINGHLKFLDERFNS